VDAFSAKIRLQARYRLWYSSKRDENARKRHSGRYFSACVPPEHPAMTFDAVVAGAGIVGAACASELVRAGMGVALIEPAIVGGGATAAGMGHLAVMDDSEAQFALTRYSRSLWKELAERLPASAEYFPCGALWVAADDDEMAEVERKHRFYSSRAVPVEVLDARALAEAEPNLRAGLAGGLRMIDDAVVYPPCAARFVVAEAASAGLQLIQGRAVTEVNDRGVRLDNGDWLSSAFSIVATGAVASKLAPAVRIQPRKGHLAITDRYPGFLRHQLIELGYLKSAHSTGGDSVAFNAQPRLTGQVLIGSSRQYGVDDPAVEPRTMNAMLRRALEYLPGLAELCVIRCWTGFRAATPDSLPLIGVCPGFENVFLSAGHEGLGISTSLATGRLLVDLMLNRNSAIAREPYLPERVFTLHAAQAKRN
jgi:glycine/D-amino acid oxidase-like deaminating enzyme